jgi:opacity protein-like surface antigen
MTGQPATPPEANAPDATAAKGLIDQYRTQVNTLTTAKFDPSHPEEIRALEMLADAMAALKMKSPALDQGATKVRDIAGQLGRSKPHAVHTDLIKEGLTAAATAIEDATHQAAVPVTVLSDAQTALSELDPAKPYRPQKEHGDRAFRLIGNALEALAKAQPPVAETPAEPEKQPVAGYEEAPPQLAAQPAPRPSVLATQIAITAGGGFSIFRDSAMSNVMGTGGGWDVRLILGTHYPIGAELAYVGTANPLDRSNVIATQGTTLVSNAFEATLRGGTPAFEHVPLQVFGFAGIGVNAFDLTTHGYGYLGLRDSDTTGVVPLGAGLQINATPNFLIDTRFTYRFMFDNDLAIGRDVDMYTFTARLGYVF